MRLVVLNVADPFSTVEPNAAGAAEKLLARLDSELVRKGHESIVMACEGSVVEGILLATPRPSGSPDDAARHAARQQYRFILQKFLEKWPIDLIHLHGADFQEYLPPPGVPVLATLHHGAKSCPPKLFDLERPQTFLTCTTGADNTSCPPCAYLLPEVEMADAAVENYLAIYTRLVREAREREAVLEQATAETARTEASPVMTPAPDAHSLPNVSLSPAHAP